MAKEQRRSDLDVVVRATQRLEQLLEQRGAVGRGLHAKTNSVAGHLCPALAKKLHVLAAVRNRVLHEGRVLSPHDRARFDQAVAVSRTKLLALLTTPGRVATLAAAPAHPQVHATAAGAELGDLGRALLRRFHRPPTLAPVRLAGGWAALALGALAALQAAMHPEAATGALVIAGLWAWIGAWILGWLPAVHLYAWLTAVWTFVAFLLLMLWAALASGIEALLRSWIPAALRAVPGGHGVAVAAVSGVASTVIGGVGAALALRQLARFGRARHRMVVTVPIAEEQSDG